MGKRRRGQRKGPVPPPPTRPALIPIPEAPEPLKTDDIKWELNSLDDDQTGSGDSRPTQPAIPVTASQIKLNIHGKQKTAVSQEPAKSQPSTSKTNVKPKIAPTFISSSKPASTSGNKPKPAAPTFVNNLKPVPLASNSKPVPLGSNTKPVPLASKSKPEANPIPVVTAPSPEKNPHGNVPKPTKPAPGYHASFSKPFVPGGNKGVAGIPRSFLMANRQPQDEYGAIQPVNPPAAGVPRSFLSNRQSQGEYGAIQPQQPEPPVHLPVVAPAFQPIRILAQANPPPPQLVIATNVDVPADTRQQYSPSDAYDNEPTRTEQETEEGRDSPESESSRKRLSAFQRLGPQTQPKKPKLTINLMYNKEQSVREVVKPEEIVPVHLRQDIIDSTDETVQTYLPHWPWKKGIIPRKTVTARSSKSAMLLEQEQMEESYEKDRDFVMVTVKRYPPTWSKEDVMDALLEAVKGKSFIPCFVEFKKDECKFMVIRSRPALTVIHKLGFYVTKEEVQLQVYLHKIDFSLKQVDYVPRLVLRKRLAKGYDSERRLDLKAFTLQPDISHFIYFPLNRAFNQMELVQLQSTVVWDYLTDLDLSHNRLTTVDGFDLPKTTPRLKNLDVSHNHLQRATALLRCRGLSLKTLRLEGNPLCHDYIDPGHYVRVLRMMFPSLMEIDGIPVKLKGDMPPVYQNYCPAEAKEVVDKYLEVYFPLLDSPPDDRAKVEDMYADNATLTVTYKYKMRYVASQRYFRQLFFRARVMEEGEMSAIEGATSIAKVICKWPSMQHDPHTFTVDVMHHSETSTIFRVNGILKLTVETLAEDEHLIAFTRTLVVVPDGVEYKILNEMLYWETPCAQYANMAFKLSVVSATKRPTLKFESAPDDDLKEKLIEVFMKITESDRTKGERCLEIKEWNFKHAIEYYMKLLKLDDFRALEVDSKENNTIS